MITLKPTAFAGASILSAVAASLCCITPVLAVVAGSTSLAGNFTWIEPVRPYLIGLSVAVLAFAWYLKLKPKKSTTVDCCPSETKIPFMQTKAFLGMVTILAVVMMTFPLYASKLFPAPEAVLAVATQPSQKKQVRFTISGMSCAACEPHVNKELAKVPGVLSSETSYATKSSLVTFDPKRVDLKLIQAAILRTGYAVRGFEIVSPSAPKTSL